MSVTLKDVEAILRASLRSCCGTPLNAEHRSVCPKYVEYRWQQTVREQLRAWWIDERGAITDLSAGTPLFSEAVVEHNARMAAQGQTPPAGWPGPRSAWYGPNAQCRECHHGRTAHSNGAPCTAVRDGERCTCTIPGDHVVHVRRPNEQLDAILTSEPEERRADLADDDGLCHATPPASLVQFDAVPSECRQPRGHDLPHIPEPLQ